MIGDTMAKLEALLADITTLRVDAIVNAANRTLLGGGGVDGAIHRAAGHQLLEACRLLGGCQTGEAKITPGFQLPARFVIHTVGPVWRGGSFGEPALLAACYKNSLRLAAQHDLTSIAFPSISTGVFGFPFEQAARIALQTARESLSDPSSIEKVIFCCFSQSDLEFYQDLLGTP